MGLKRLLEKYVGPIINVQNNVLVTPNRDNHGIYVVQVTVEVQVNNRSHPAGAILINPTSGDCEYKVIGWSDISQTWANSDNQADIVTQNPVATEKIRAYDKIRSKTPKRMELHARINERYERKHPGRRLVNGQVAEAVKSGKIIKPDVCQICGAPNPVSHHHDYNKPFDVLWVCNSCHRKIHVQIDKGELPAIVERNPDIVISKDKTRVQTRKTYNPGVGRSNNKHVAQIDETGKICRVFCSQVEASRHFGINKQNISSVCLGKRKRASGMYFRNITQEEYEKYQHQNGG